MELEEGRFEEAAPLGSLVQGLSDVTVMGRVITVWPLKRFKRPSGGEGTLLRLLLADNSGKMRCVIWNPDKGIVELSLQGKLLDRAVKIVHGYTRGGLRGDLEVHVGERGEIHLISDERASQLPSLESYILPIRDIRSGEVNLKCCVDETPQTRIFTRNNGEEGKVSRVKVSDGFASAVLVVWDERADELSTVKPRETLLVLNAKANRRPDGILEIHAGKGTVIQKIGQGIKKNRWKGDFLRIDQLKPGMTGVNLRAYLLAAVPLPESNAVNALLADGEHLIGATFWKDKILGDIEYGKGIIQVENASIRDIKGEPWINVGMNSNYKIYSPKELEGKGYVPSPSKPVGEVEFKRRRGLYIVEGRVVEVPNIREVNTSGGEVKVASFRLNVQGREIDVSLWRELAEAASNLKPNDEIKLIGVRVKRRLNGRTEISSGRLSRLEKLEKTKPKKILPNRGV